MARANIDLVNYMLTARLFKTATCLSLTLLSALLPSLEALGQVVNTDQPGIWTPTQGQAPGKTPADNQIVAPGAPGSAMSPIPEPVFEPYKGPALQVAPDGSITDATTKSLKEAAKHPPQPFSEIKDPLVTHPGGDSPARSKNTATASARADEPLGMVSPVFKPGSKAAIEEAKMKAEQKLRASQPMKLYGRIEQLTATSGANFPVVFKAMTPQLDTTPDKKLTGKVGSDPALFPGTIAKSFPSDFRGNWGGTLKVWTVVQDPICYKIDPVEAAKLAKIFKSGAEGQVNFMFANEPGGGIYLAPANVMFQESGADAGLGQQMSQMMGGQSLAAMGPMGAMMQQMAASMPVPVIFSFGDIASSSMAKGLSGNDFVQRTLRNTTRQLAPNVLEQDIVAESNEIMKSTGQPRQRYSESVLRFTKVNEQQMYVQAAAVTYGPTKGFQDKVIMYGYVTKASGSADQSLCQHDGGHARSWTNSRGRLYIWRRWQLWTDAAAAGQRTANAWK